MPHKFNAAQRHKFKKKQYRVTNWPAYNEGLRQRGDLTVWIGEDAVGNWAAPRRKSRGRQPKSSDLAITICLTLGVVYKLPLRQTQGLMRSIAKLMGLAISVPDFSTLSRRGRWLKLPAKSQAGRTEPVHLVVPPPKNAVPSPQSADDPTLRDRHIAEIQTHGRMAWQISSGYNLRSRGETQMGRWKVVIGSKLSARCLDNQKTEARIGVDVLNKMTSLGRPECEAVC